MENKKIKFKIKTETRIPTQKMVLISLNVLKTIVLGEKKHTYYCIPFTYTNSFNHQNHIMKLPLLSSPLLQVRILERERETAGSHLL